MTATTHAATFCAVRSAGKQTQCIGQCRHRRQNAKGAQSHPASERVQHTHVAPTPRGTGVSAGTTWAVRYRLTFPVIDPTTTNHHCRVGQRLCAVSRKRGKNRVPSVIRTASVPPVPGGDKSGLERGVCGGRPHRKDVHFRRGHKVRIPLGPLQLARSCSLRPRLRHQAGDRLAALTPVDAGVRMR
jgi:hypothetical protein